MHSTVSKVIKALGIKNCKKQKFRTEPMKKKQTIDQSVQSFTVNIVIESSCWMMNVISQNVGPTLMEMTFFTPITKI